MSTTSTSQKNNDKGAGDTLARIFTMTGVKKAVEVISEATGIECGCDKRQEQLNKILPYKKD